MENNRRRSKISAYGLNSLSENEKVDFLISLDETLEKIRYREISIAQGFIEITRKFNSDN